MAELEKVIKAFDEAKELVWTDDDEYTVGYNNGLEAGKNIALTLLKGQEEVEPKKTAYQRVDHKIAYRYRCGVCDQSIFPSYKFCPFCGQAVKWE